MNFSVVILAGGRSSRMGRDKAWLDCDGQPLIQRQIELVQRLQPVEIFISARPGKAFDSLGRPVVPDNFPDQGPLAGMESALGVMQTPMLLALAVDLPRMQERTLRRIAARCQNCGGVPCFHGTAEPLAALYPKAAHSIATELLRDQQNSVTLFARRCLDLGLVVFHDLPVALRADFANWNSPADVAEDDRTPG